MKPTVLGLCLLTACSVPSVDHRALPSTAAGALDACLAAHHDGDSQALWFATARGAERSELLVSDLAGRTKPRPLLAVEHASGFPPRASVSSAGIVWSAVPRSGKRGSPAVVAWQGVDPDRPEELTGPVPLAHDALELAPPLAVGPCAVWVSGEPAPGQAGQQDLDAALRLHAWGRSWTLLEARATWLQPVAVVDGQLAVYELQAKQDRARLRLLGGREAVLPLGAGYARDLHGAGDALTLTWWPEGQLRRVGPSVDEVLRRDLPEGSAALLAGGRIVTDRSWQGLLAVPEAPAGPLWVERRQTDEQVAWWLGSHRLQGELVSWVGTR